MLTRDLDYGPRFLEEFQDKLLYGTDLCHVGMEMPLADTLREWRDTGKISAQVFNKIARENAIKLLGL
jgi:predicted TIM-barrel fold metal-dependent hydrolase